MAHFGLMVVHGAPEVGRTVPLAPGRRLRLGRHGPEQGIDLTLTILPVNRHHADVWWDEGGLWVQDLHSVNGTFVDGGRLSLGPIAQAPLAPCDWLRLAVVRLRVIWLGPLDPSWLAWNGQTIPRIARDLHAGGEGDITRGFRVLHDALIDAGCADEPLLAHCRAGCPHGADCTLLPLLASGPRP